MRKAVLDTVLVSAFLKPVPEEPAFQLLGLAVARVVRDPNANMIVACALVADADYIVTRDKDLLSPGKYGSIAMFAPEAFLHVLRAVP